MLNCSLVDLFRKAFSRERNAFSAIFIGMLMAGLVGIFGVAQSQEPHANTIYNNAPGKESVSVKKDEGSADFSAYFQGLSKGELSGVTSSLSSTYAEVYRNKPPRKPKGPPILHIKSKGGIKFIKIEADPKVKEEIEKNIPKVAEYNYKAMIADFEREITEKATIPLCKDTKSKIIQTVAQLTKQQASRLQPVLMIQKDLVPQDERIAFGINTKVMTFEVTTLAGLPDFLKMTGFECLPSRMHVSKKGLLLIQGEDALKNYDQDEKGRLDKGVERLWQALKIRYRAEESSKFGDLLAEFEKK